MRPGATNPEVRHAGVGHDAQGKSGAPPGKRETYLWHGNSANALACLRDVDDVLEGWDYDDDGEKQPQPGSEAAGWMLKYVREMATYIANNAGSIVNYGERYRNGERIRTGFVESTINQVVSKRMVKKQQMQWTPEGAHLLLQVRTQVLNDDWEGTFHTWYPNFRRAERPATVTLIRANLFYALLGGQAG